MHHLLTFSTFQNFIIAILIVDEKNTIHEVSFLGGKQQLGDIRSKFQLGSIGPHFSARVNAFPAKRSTGVHQEGLCYAKWVSVWSFSYFYLYMYDSFHNLFTLNNVWKHKKYVKLMLVYLFKMKNLLELWQLQSRHWPKHWHFFNILICLYLVDNFLSNYKLEMLLSIQTKFFFIYNAISWKWNIILVTDRNWKIYIQENKWKKIQTLKTDPK